MRTRGRSEVGRASCQDQDGLWSHGLVPIARENLGKEQVWLLPYQLNAMNAFQPLTEQDMESRDRTKCKDLGM